MGRCPPGVFCIESMTIVFLTISMVVGYFFYTGFFNYISTKISNKHFTLKPLYQLSHEYQVENSSNGPLLNPHNPPLRDGGYFPKSNNFTFGLPINVKTRGYDTSYRQVGILTRENGDGTFLPLMGRPLHANRGKWQFYTMSDKNNSVKLPLSKNGRSCTSEYGCDDFFNGDSVYVEGYNDSFKVTIYENEAPRYIPL